MTGHVHDPRHRYSYELRPDEATDATLRQLAAQLEAGGRLPGGASTAPRFHPHLTLLRADRADPALVAELAARVAPALQLGSSGSFGDGRIAWLAPAVPAELAATRAWLVEQLGATHVDPLALSRDPWVPHVTVAYAVDEAHRPAVLDALADALPLAGEWASVEAWDLDVRPTVRVARASVTRSAAP